MTRKRYERCTLRHPETKLQCVKPKWNFHRVHQAQSEGTRFLWYEKITDKHPRWKERSK